MNLSVTTLQVCTNEQPSPERIRKVPIPCLPDGAIHQPQHQLMSDQLEAVVLDSGLRKNQLAGCDLQRGMAPLPAELKSMPVRTLPWTDSPKLARQQCLQRGTKILLSRQAAAVGREQGQEGNIRHGRGHRRAVAHKNGPS